jgi:hypothetical protein
MIGQGKDTRSRDMVKVRVNGRDLYVPSQATREELAQTLDPSGKQGLIPLVRNPGGEVVLVSTDEPAKIMPGADLRGISSADRG